MLCSAEASNRRLKRMPRWNRDASSDAAARAFRLRLASSMTPDRHEPLLQLPGGDDSEPWSDDSLALPEPATARLRWRTPWRVAVLLAFVAAGIVIWQFWHSATGNPSAEPLGASMTAGSDEVVQRRGDETAPPHPSGSQAGAAESAGSVVVHVAGAVQKPGVVSLPLGSRIHQAIDAAGGASAHAELNGLNLAQVLSDGAKIHVPAVGEAAANAPSGVAGESGATGGAAESNGTPGMVNINTATVDELETLPRVGPVTAQRIVDWRKEHGPFASVDELDAIDGIGPKLVESLQKLVTVQGG